MNSLRQFFQKQSTISSGLRSLYKNTLSGESVINRLPVRTPFNVNINKNVLKPKWISRNLSNDLTRRVEHLLPKLAPHRGLHDIAGSPKKRTGLRKKRSEYQEKMAKNGYFNVTAYATAEEYDLEKLLAALKTQDLYEPKKFLTSDDNSPDVLYATAKYQVGAEPREIFFFREGTVVMWNCSDMEISNILGFLKSYEQVSEHAKKT